MPIRQQGICQTHAPSGLPRSRVELRLLLTIFLLERALHELDQALEIRPAWAQVPLRGLLELLPVGLGYGEGDG